MLASAVLIVVEHCRYLSTNFDFSQPYVEWQNPPNTRPSSGPVAIAQGVWAQFGQALLAPPDTQPPIDADNRLYVLTNTTWTATSAIVTETFNGLDPTATRYGTNDRARVAGPATDPTLYMSAKNASDGALGLKRVQHFLPGTGTTTVDNADAGIVIATSWLGRPVWAVDPQDPARLVAVDTVSNQLVFSSASGAAGSWTPNNLGTVTASGSGNFFFGSGGSTGGWTTVNVIGIDPTNGSRILLRTEGNGIAATFDRGASWVRVPGSERMPRISGFFFDERTADVYISTYARGLWKMGWCSNSGAADTTTPTFTFVPPDIVTANCGTVDIGTARAVDMCSAGAVTITNNRPAKFLPGTTVVTWTARDAAGNAKIATQRVTLILRDDTACCPPGTNIIVGTSNNDVLNGTAGSDCILGRGAQDIINGNGGNDYISGGEGDDIINGGAGDDVVFGGSGQDTITDTSGNDQLFGDGGDDKGSLVRR